MPIFEYRCHGCSAEFEKLLFSQKSSVPCPHCGSDEVERKHSVFGTSGTEKQVTGRSSCSGCSATTCSSCSAG